MIIDLSKNLHLSAGEKSLWNAVCHFNHAQPDAAQRQKSIDIFTEIVSYVRNENLSLNNIPKVLLQAPFDMRSQTGERSVAVLRQSVNRKDQFMLLDSVPSDDVEVQRQFKAGFPVTLNAFKGAQFDSLIDMNALMRCRNDQELKNKMLLFCMQHDTGITFHEIVHCFDKLYSPELDKKGINGNLRRNMAFFILSMIIFKAENPSDRCKASHVTAFIDLMPVIQKQGGQVLIGNCLNQGKFASFQATPSAYIGFLHNLNELIMHKESKALVKKIMLSQKTPKILMQQVNTAYSGWFDRKYNEKSIAKVKQDFLNVEKNIHPDVLELLIKDYGIINRYYSRIKSFSDAEIKDFVSDYRNRVFNKSLTHKDKLELIAVIRESIRRHFGILPHNTQIIAFLGAIHHVLYDVNHTDRNLGYLFDGLKGHVPQVNTGEGKSTVVALKAAFFSIHGRVIDIITSSSTLAIRDYRKYKGFYESFGVTSSHICVEKPQQHDYAGQILYGQNTDFEFGYLRQQSSFDKARMIENQQGLLAERLFDIAIVDEVDNLLIDKGQTNAIISIGQHSSGRLLLKPVFNIVNSLGRRESDTLNATTIQSLMQQLLSKAQHKGYADVVVKALNSTNKLQLHTWFNSCYEALYKYKENVDYIVGKPCDEDAISNSNKTDHDQIIIIDTMTGKQQPQSRWQNKLHEFLELKHNLPVSAESYTGAEISHPVFFSFYKNIFGLTGTLGSDMERQELLDTFKIGSFDVPPHYPNQRESYIPIITSDENSQFEVIAGEIMGMKKAGRPTLILTDTITLSERLSGFLSEQKVQAQLLNTLQEEDEEFVVMRAGQAGQVTVATNTASRGTDVDIIQNIKNIGGLHVLLAYYPDNERVEMQGVGRAARQGAPGSSRLILARSRLPFEIHDIENLSDESLLEKLHESRQYSDLMNIVRRKTGVQQNIKRQLFLEKYYKGIQYLNQSLNAALFSELAKKTNLDNTRLNTIKHLTVKPDDGKLAYSSSNESVKTAFFENQKQILMSHLDQLWGQIYDGVSKNEDAYAFDTAFRKFNTLFSELFSSPETSFEAFCSQHLV